MNDKTDNASQTLIRPFEPGDELGINILFNAIFSQKRSLREWIWKFGKRGERGIVLVAVDEQGEILAHYSALKSRFWIYDQHVHGGHVVDIFSSRDPMVVRKRTFVKLQREFYRRFGDEGEYPVFVGFPGTRSERLTKVTGISNRSHPVTIWRGHVTSEHGIGKHEGWKVDAKIRIDEVDDLWERAKSRHRFTGVRDGEWITQRYFEHPRLSNSYRVLAARRGVFLRRGELEAWGVFKATNDGVLWVDLEWDGRDEVALDALWREAVKQFCLAQNSRLEIWLDGDPAVEAWLEKRGLRRVDWPDGPWFAYRVYPACEQLLIDNEKFRITAGDSDIV